MRSLKLERIGLFGGAFDPPHRGHQRALACFLSQVEPDVTYVIPTGSPPHKRLDGGASPEARLAMAKDAFLPLSPTLRLWDGELFRESVSYTYLTVQALEEKHPQAEFFLYVGTDQFLQFETWREPEYLAQKCTLCVMSRDGDEACLMQKKEELKKGFGARCLLLTGEAYIISSTSIREQLIKEGDSPHLPPCVAERITCEELYGCVATPEKRRALEILKKRLTPERFSHTLAVEREAVRIARALGLTDTAMLSLAALYHDYDRELTEEEVPESVKTPDAESVALLHGVITAERDEISSLLEEDALQALRYHTTGRSGMSLTEKILYLADFIEETRRHAVCQRVRSHFWEEGISDRAARLDECIILALENTIIHLEEKNKPVHPFSRQALTDLKRKGSTMTSEEKAKKIARILDEKKGKELALLKVREQTVITDYFVIASAGSSTHLKALCDEVEFVLRQEDGISADRVEGYSGGGWILVDFGDVIVHLFDAQNRDFFKLEKLWAQSEPVPFEAKED